MEWARSISCIFFSAKVNLHKVGRSAYRGITKENAELPQETSVSLEECIQIDRYYVSRRDLGPIAHSSIRRDEPTRGEVPAAFSAGFHILVKGFLTLPTRELLSEIPILPVKINCTLIT